MTKAPVDHFDLPPCRTRLPRHGQLISWEAVMRETQAFREYYRIHFDSPEKCLAEKNPEPFRLV